MVYLNNAATSWPKAPGVAEAVQLSFDRPAVEPGRGSSTGDDPVKGCRERMAELLDVADASRIIFTLNATAALNLAIQGVTLHPGDLVVTSAAEHNSVLRPIEKLRRERPLKVEIIGITPEGCLDEEQFHKALDSGPRLVVLTHASNVTGRVFDVAPLFEAAKKAGALTLLDASQSLGAIPVQPETLHADLVAFTGHKALLGPTGTGGLYVAPGTELEQAIVGGTGARSDLLEHPREMPQRLEAGTANLAGLAGLRAALGWLDSNGDEHRAAASRLARCLRTELVSIEGVQLFDQCGEGENTGIVSFRIAGWDVQEAGMILGESFGVICRAGLHCAPLMHSSLGTRPEGTVRFSVSGFNSEDEIDSAISAVRQLALCAR
jgi:cysteine desulfurase family protein